MTLTEESRARVGRPTSHPVPARTSGGAHRIVTGGLLIVGLAVALGVLGVVAAASGQLPIPATEVASGFLRGLGVDLGPAASHPRADATLWSVRFPRVAMAMVVGAALAVAGALMQGAFGNPLAEPSVVGVSAGAAVGAAAAIVFGLTAFGVWTSVVCAFVAGILTTTVVYLFSRSNGRTEVVTLVLTGIAVNAVAGAALALLMFLGDTQAREEIVFWQLGSLNGSRWDHVLVVAPLALLGLALATRLARPLDLLALGERPARHLGVDVERLRIHSILLVGLLTAAAVSFCGIVAFVGLVVPHLIRMIAGPGHRLLLPASALGGAVCLLAADLLARTAVDYAELPLGMVTAAVGGPFFFWLLHRTRRTAGGWG
ncbi:FecCD family ABC transporter permease [Dietzia sp. DQ12-76]|uniref:FecCD family ABC transporter permease n=1 Tax=Dietzia sp. DQ12-76 TaxID=1630639 RepID=UPI0015F8C6A1|nr:iron ABC transporter permease [Dietzia sp. DQ12-76]MBB1028065.1 iron ABC transporter permease [Dietzia sp. DQ11-38-2]